MRSDRQELPEGFTKEDADKAEIAEAKLLASSRSRNARSSTATTNALAAAAPTDCMIYFPAWQYQVCGAIRVKYDSLGGVNSFLLWPTSNELVNPDQFGRRQTFLNGPIYWSAASGAHPVVNHFFAAWQRNGWETGPLGYPTTDEIANPSTAPGRRQEFQNTAAIYWNLNEAYAIRGAVRDKWNTVGAEQGFLGYPTSDERVTPNGIGRFNTFSGGVIYWAPTTGAHPVSGLVLAEWKSSGYEAGTYGFPTSDQYTSTAGATVQDFQNGQIAFGPHPAAKTTHFDCQLEAKDPIVNNTTTWITSTTTVGCTDPKVAISITVDFFYTAPGTSTEKLAWTQSNLKTDSGNPTIHDHSFTAPTVCVNGTYRARATVGIVNADGGQLPNGFARSLPVNITNCRTAPFVCPNIEQSYCDKAVDTYIWLRSHNFSPPPGYDGGGAYHDTAGQLPPPAWGYEEFDIQPPIPGSGRQDGRLVIDKPEGNSHGNMFFTKHYTDGFVPFTVPI